MPFDKARWAFTDVYHTKACWCRNSDAAAAMLDAWCTSICVYVHTHTKVHSHAWQQILMHGVFVHVGISIIHISVRFHTHIYVYVHTHIHGYIRVSCALAVVLEIKITLFYILISWYVLYSSTQKRGIDRRFETAGCQRSSWREYIILIFKSWFVI